VGRDFQHRRNLILSPHLIIIVPTLRNSKSKSNCWQATRSSCSRSHYQRTVFQKLVCLQIFKTSSQSEHGITKSKHDDVVRPLPLFGSGTPHAPQLDPVAKGRVLVARARPLKSRRTNREAKTVALGQCRSHSNVRPTKNPRAFQRFARGLSGHINQIDQAACFLDQPWQAIQTKRGQFKSACPFASSRYCTTSTIRCWHLGHSNVRLS